MFLGLDVSTSICGWSIVDQSGSVVKWGYVKFPSKTKKRPALSLFQKMDMLMENLQANLGDYKDKIEAWGVEEAMKKFQGGKSTAQVIYTCASFNFGVAHSMYKFMGSEPIYIPVTTARKMVGLKITRGLDKTARKGEVVAWCKPRHSSIVWGLTRNGTYQQWCFDVADSLVISEAIRLTHGTNP